MTCSRCGTSDRLTEHHIYPVCHFGHKHDGLKVKLCVSCHRRFEDCLLGIESHIGNIPFGKRYKLDKSDYERALRNFLHNRTIIYVAVWSWILVYDCLVSLVDNCSSLSPPALLWGDFQHQKIQPGIYFYQFFF